MTVIRFYSLRQSFRRNAAKCDLADLQCHDKGEIRLKRSGEKYENYGASIHFSKCGWDDLPGQVKDAKRFLKKQGGELRKLIRGIAVDLAGFDFPVNASLAGELTIRQYFFDEELLALCAKHSLAINLASYEGKGWGDIGIVTARARTTSRSRARPRPGRSRRRPGRQTKA